MSFILDALKKSENDRQDAVPAEFTGVSSGSDLPSTPKWLWVLGGLLLLNVVVLASVLLRPAPEAAASATPARAEAPAASGAATAFSERVADARRNQPAPAERRVVTESPPVASEAVTTGNTTVESAPVSSPPPTIVNEPVSPATDAGAGALLPTLTELRASGLVNLPAMHVDIHVYSDTPADRFVFINMNKYRENAQTAEGALLREITPDGVVLEFRGRAFLLPRE